jgi:hypothetical protein
MLFAKWHLFLQTPEQDFPAKQEMYALGIALGNVFLDPLV